MDDNETRDDGSEGSRREESGQFDGSAAERERLGHLNDLNPLLDIQMVSGPLVFVHVIDFITWIRAMHRGSGTTERDYVGIPIKATHISENGQQEVVFTLCITAEGAVAIVRGIRELMEGGLPDDLNLPGAN